jgi:hypothetical protein
VRGEHAGRGLDLTQIRVPGAGGRDRDVEIEDHAQGKLDDQPSLNEQAWLVKSGPAHSPCVRGGENGHKAFL